MLFSPLTCSACGKSCEEHEFLVRRDTKSETRRKICKSCRGEIHRRRKEAHTESNEADICSPSDQGFWARVDRNGPVAYEHLDVCWLWSGSKINSGYGIWRFSNNTYRLVLAHRFMWMSTYGEIPEGQLVLHKCDNKLCVNPSHLFLGSYSDNVQDCLQKGRFVVGARRRGEECNRAKITEGHVREIRELRQQGLLQREIAARLGTTREIVSSVLRGATWRHVQ